MTPRVVIIILNWNGWQETIECLESIFRNSYPNYEVVVIDNGSQNDSVTKIREWARGGRLSPGRYVRTEPVRKPVPIISLDKHTAERGGVSAGDRKPTAPGALWFVLIQNDSNLGFAGGNNIGIRYACSQSADYVLLLNNDAFFRSPGALSAMVGFMEATPRAGACGGRLFYPDGSPQQSFGNFPAVPRTLAYLFPLYKLLPRRWFKNVNRSNVVPDDSVQNPIRVDWPSGACLLVRGRTIDEVGMLDERYFLYMEETDWCFRMRSKGWDRYYLPQAEVIHAFGGSVRKASISMRRFHLESQFTFYRKHFSTWARVIVAAGYFFRAICSVPVLTVAAEALTGLLRGKVRESARYWLLALRLSVAALHGIRSRNNT